MGPDFLQDLDNVSENFYLPIFIAYVFLFYLIGEYGLFFSLIKLLDSYANKSKISFGEDPKRTTHGSFLLENHFEENYKGMYNPFSKENNEDLSEEVSVSFN